MAQPRTVQDVEVKIMSFHIEPMKLISASLSFYLFILVSMETKTTKITCDIYIYICSVHFQEI